MFGAAAPPLSQCRGVIDTTVDELEGFNIVRAIICSEVAVERVHARDAKSYFAILLDDNNRKTICRLHFNGSRRYLGLLDESKVEKRVLLERLSDLYGHADQLRDAARKFA